MLLPHHLSDLRRSGLDDATIAACGFYSETKLLNLAALLNWHRMPKVMASALVVRYRDVNGDLNGYARIKPDVPRKDAQTGKPIKYESPRGFPNRAFVPPLTIAALDAPQSELLITEGEKKAAKSDQEGFPCVGLVGVFGWKDKHGERLILDLERIAWQNRRVFIVFDSDIAGNETVANAEVRLAAQLKQRGAVVRVVRLPAGPHGEKVGLDDFLVAEGRVALRKLLSTAEEPAEPEGSDSHPDARELDPMHTARRFLDVGYCTHERRTEVLRLRHYCGEFWIWDESAGKYGVLSGDGLRCVLRRYLDTLARNVTNSVVANVVDCLKALTFVREGAQMPCWLDDRYPPAPAGEILATENQLVHLAAFSEGQPAQFPPTPKFFSRHALQVPFDLETPEPVEWLRFLEQLWPGDAQSQETMREWIGHLLLPDTRYQKILLLVGPKRSGKGTLARVVRALIGADNVVGPTLSSLSGPFGLWPLLGKLAAIVSDARLSGRTDAAVITERLLSISGEDAITIDRKCLEPVTVRLPTRLMILTNELPRLGDASGALVSRMIVLRLVHSFYGQEDLSLTDRLLGELPGILLWAIAGWDRLRRRGRFLQPDSGAELLDELEDLSSPTAQFVRECCMLDPSALCPVAELYFSWRNWCEQKGRKEAGTEQTFGRDLLAVLPGLQKTRPGVTQRYRAYRGITLRPTL